jgi:hypothetical protein
VLQAGHAFTAAMGSISTKAAPTFLRGWFVGDLWLDGEFT